ncbi:zinc-binding dehydrogenase, partial [Streptomyces sp. GbtcB7]|uniref:zinc-binding dehydrogenase n=1 Tax=Streptomyces sp. GbtcB7 TaxID=2824752 RepID=UPI001C307F19
ATRNAGASQVFEVDISPEKRPLARETDAPLYVDASDTTARGIRSLTGHQGVDVAVEGVGRAVSIPAAWDSTRRREGASGVRVG